jgi:hypothetical protein
LAQHPDLPQQLRSTQVLIRFGLRMLILLSFAAFAHIGFARSLAALLWMCIVFSAVIGTIKREPPFGAVLNHWDEMLAYAACCCLVAGTDQAVPF